MCAEGSHELPIINYVIRIVIHINSKNKTYSKAIASKEIKDLDI